MKKKEYKVYNLKSRKVDASDRLYWSSKTPEERIAAMEVIRQQWYKIKNERPIPMNRDEELYTDVTHRRCGNVYRSF